MDRDQAVDADRLDGIGPAIKPAYPAAPKSTALKVVIPNGKMADKDKPRTLETPAVRFSSSVEEKEISPVGSIRSPDLPDAIPKGATEDEIQQLTQSLRGANLQDNQTGSNYQFESFSLPVSRVPSRDAESGESSGLSSPISTTAQSPHISTTTTAMASPPLTPAATDARERKLTREREEGGKAAAAAASAYASAAAVAAVAAAAHSNDPSTITPQASTSHERKSDLQRPNLVGRPVSDYGVIRAASAEETDARSRQQHRKSMVVVGAASTPGSRNPSPSRVSASALYSKPFTPIGEPDDPYAAHRRQPQSANPSVASVDARFRFSRRRPGSPSRPLASAGPADKRSGIFSTFRASNEDVAELGGGHSRHGSMADLKKFFKRGHGKKRDGSPSGAAAGSKTPPSTPKSKIKPGMLFDDQALTSKYGKMGKMLGQGAGGSVRLMKRRDTGTVFAVKEFRARHQYETEKSYGKKVTAEFCVGSTLHHPNIIETLDIVQERNQWYQVMEYAPFDLFAIVMTGRMKREEVTCCFLQVLSGVTYLHSMGLAHRDLKLDNVVVSKDGIMKIIDFGSSHVFQYPFENGIVRAKGIVGSDPYLAPEVYETREYDAEAADIWSLAIIYCCMTLRRFPWKIPRPTDSSFKLFLAEPAPEHEPSRLIPMRRPGAAETPVSSSTPLRSRSRERAAGEDSGAGPVTAATGAAGASSAAAADPKGDGESRGREGGKDPNQAGSSSVSTAVATDTTTASGPDKKDVKEVIKGPWRILRLLPRESRHIMHRMLDVNPLSRANIREITEEPWVADTVICRQADDGSVMSAENHQHTLEPPVEPSPAPAP